MGEDKIRDPYIVYAKDVKPRAGYSVLDEAKTMPRVSIARTYETIAGEEQGIFKRDPSTVLCPGAAIGRHRQTKTITHFSAGEDLDFLGFLIANGDKETAVRVRGSALLLIPDLTSEDIGRPVYCTGPNEFSLEKSRGAACIGGIRYIEGRRAAVFFKRFDDERPLDLNIGVR